MSSTLPEFAQKPWPMPEQPTGAASQAPQPTPDPLAEQIAETHQGVQALQVLVAPKEGEDPSKIDLLLEGQEAILGQVKALSAGLDLLFYRLHELYRATGTAIPPPPRRD